MYEIRPYLLMATSVFFLFKANNAQSIQMQLIDVSKVSSSGNTVVIIYCMILNMVAGHFTQLVWSVSRRLGVGIAR